MIYTLDPHRRLFWTLLLVIAGALVIGSPAYATVIRNYEFDVDGVLPSTDPEIDYFSFTGLNEASVFSVSGGLLQQRSYGLVGSALYQFGGLLPGCCGGLGTEAGIDPDESAQMEARFRILRTQGVPNAAAFDWKDGAYQFGMDFAGSDPMNLDVRVRTPSGHLTIATIDASEFHTYRLQTEGGNGIIEAFIDDQLVYTGAARESIGLNRFYWGDNRSNPNVGADVDWDFVRFSQPAGAVPEPTTLALLALGLAGLGYRRRQLTV